jgi:CheY-like chemotaxis protein
VFRSVLVVEDEEPLRRVIAPNLTVRGVQVREAANADEALKAVAAERPDLMLLDITCPTTRAGMCSAS